MNIILFLGSGISIPSGHPDVVTITEKILNSNTPESNFLKALSNYDAKARLISGNINRITNETIGEIYRNYTSYEDLYYLCEEIGLFDWGLHNNSMIPAFMESLIDNMGSLLKGNSRENKLLEIGKYAHAAKQYINSSILKDLSLKEPNIVGLNLIVQLADNPKITSLNILTLNHDLLVEQLLSNNGIPFADGFGSADGDVRWFEPDKFLSNIKIKLIKLHGSIDWYSFAVGYERIAKIVTYDSDKKKDSNGNTLQLASKSPKVLSGLNKIKYYNSGMYTDIHYHFQRVLYQNNLMIMSGYGWGDDPINNRLMTWLDKKLNHKLILLHEKPEQLMKRSMVMDRDYSNWEKLGKLKVIRKWLQHTTLDEVMNSLTD